jgi:hypothetical protein
MLMELLGNRSKSERGSLTPFQEAIERVLGLLFLGIYLAVGGGGWCISGTEDVKGSRFQLPHSHFLGSMEKDAELNHD